MPRWSCKHHLLDAAEQAGFDLFVTADQELSYQQNLDRPENGAGGAEHEQLELHQGGYWRDHGRYRRGQARQLY